MDNDIHQVLLKLYTHANPSCTTFLTQETYVLAIESVYNMVVITDCEGVVQYANPAVERITGFNRDEVIGQKVGLWGGMMGKAFYTDMWNTIIKGRVFKGELQNHRKDGDLYVARLTISPIKKDKKVIGFVGTEEDITLERKLQKEKEEFIALASHQLRTPLGVMKWNLELLLNDYPKLEKDLTNIANQNQYMIDLVNRLLLVIRIGDNRLEVKKTNINIDLLLKNILSHFFIKLKNTSLNLKVVNATSHDIVVLTDAILMQEIVSNLVDNAIKYSKNKGTIIVQITKQKTHWNLTVKDTGIGISSKDIPVISSKYYRGSNTTSIPGTGLGMYIVNTYVQKLKGIMKIKSVLNRGTEIVCSFPIR